MKTKIFILSSLLCVYGAMSAHASDCMDAGCEIEKLNTVEKKDDLVGVGVCALIFCGIVLGILLLCITDGKFVDETNRRHETEEHYFKSPEEMVELFQDLPEALENTVLIAKRCNYLSKKVDPLLPIFECPDGRTQDEFITEEAYRGLDERMKIAVYNDSQTKEERLAIDEKYYARIEYELSVINKMGFPGYFLIVSDFIGSEEKNI